MSLHSRFYHGILGVHGSAAVALARVVRVFSGLQDAIPAIVRILMFRVACLLVLYVHPVLAQSDDHAPPPEWHKSYEMFQMLLEQRGLVVTDSLTSSLSTPSESVVILLGDQRIVPHDGWLQLRRFVGQGGSLLVASEQNLQLPGVCSFFAGDAKSINDEDRYLKFADCLRLTSVNPDHPLTQGVDAIVVNRTGWLTPPTDESLSWQVIASLPDDCSPRAARGQPVVLAGLDPEPDRGVIILAADKSLFSNGMLWHGDNAVFAIRTTDLLCRGHRKRLTLIIDGRPQPVYSQNAVIPPPGIPPQLPPNIDPPEPELATMLKFANIAVDKVQSSNIFNETLRDRPRNMRPVAWLRTVLLILVLLAVLLVLWKLMQTRFLQTPSRQTQFMQSMYGVQSANQIAASEFGTAVEVLARDLCAEITGSRAETDWIRLMSTESHSSATLSRGLRKGLKEVAGIAVKGCRVHISRRRFQAIGTMIQELRALHRSGRLGVAVNPALV